MYITEPAVTFCRALLPALFIFGIITCLDVVTPAVERSTADFNTVTPTPTAAIEAFACEAFIVTNGKSVDVFIPTPPVELTKSLSMTLPFTLKTRSESGATLTPNAVACIPVVAVKTPATVILFKVDTPTVAFVLPARVP